MANGRDDALTSLTSITHRTLSYETYAILKQSILNLELAPGAPIDETRVAQRLGISKTPVREAIARLEGERLVVSTAGRRSYVAEIAPQSVREMFRVRMLLEASALHDIAPSLSAAQLDQVAVMLDPGPLDPDTDDIWELISWNGRFHANLVQLSDNDYLCALVNALLDQAHRASAALIRANQQAALAKLMRATIARHHAIHHALTIRDAPQAAHLLRTDIQSFLLLLDEPEIIGAFST